MGKDKYYFQLPIIMGELFTFTANFFIMKKEILPEHQELLILIGNKIKDLRTAKNISYEQMAKNIGISRNTYNLLEHGKLSFQFTTLLMVLRYHNISISDFFNDL